MSDDFAEFMRKVDKMIDRAIGYVDLVTVLYIRNVSAEVIFTTPGPNLQWPETTEYIAQGRLRGAWRWSTQPLDIAGRWDGGPYTEHGDETLSAIEAAVGQHPPAVSYLVNDVAYGYLIQEALGRHSAERPGRDWVEIMPHKQERLLREAQREAAARF